MTEDSHEHHEHHAHHGSSGKMDGAYAIAGSFIIAAVILSASMLYAVGNINFSLQQINTGLADVKVAMASRPVAPPAGGNEPVVPPIQPTALPTAPPSGTANPNIEGIDFLGPEDAPVTIVEYSDFGCPFCERFVSQTLPSLKQQYIDSGKVRFYFKQYPIPQLHPNAPKAAEGSLCASDQGQFWAFHDLVFESGQYDPASLKQHAETLGLDTDAFNSCLDNGDKTAEVQAHVAEGSQFGVSGTPTFFINGKKLVGAQPLERFQAEIDGALAA
ncbi:DsbA family protein [Candidatus Micrarchaeota archaeon]|nr:DsbA family protein [Candidatus Micrarchaeota archaeon]